MTSWISSHLQKGQAYQFIWFTTMVKVRAHKLPFQRWLIGWYSLAVEHEQIPRMSSALVFHIHVIKTKWTQNPLKALSVVLKYERVLTKSTFNEVLFLSKTTVDSIFPPRRWQTIKSQPLIRLKKSKTTKPEWRQIFRRENGHALPSTRARQCTQKEKMWRQMAK